MINFFKAEDFDLTWNDKFGNIQSLVAAQANAKLEREGKVVYGRSDSEYWGSEKRRYPHVTHQALLIGIEKREPCKHPIEKISDIALARTPTQPYALVGYQCECGAQVKPTSFEAVE